MRRLVTLVLSLVIAHAAITAHAASTDVSVEDVTAIPCSTSGTPGCVIKVPACPSKPQGRDNPNDGEDGASCDGNAGGGNDP